MTTLVFGVLAFCGLFNLLLIRVAMHPTSNHTAPVHLLADRGKLPHVAWKAIFHYDGDDPLTTVIVSGITQPLYSSQTRAFSMRYPRQTNRGGRGSFSLHCCTTSRQNRGGEEEHIRPSALLVCVAPNTPCIRYVFPAVFHHVIRYVEKQ